MVFLETCEILSVSLVFLYLDFELFLKPAVFHPSTSSSLPSPALIMSNSTTAHELSILATARSIFGDISPTTSPTTTTSHHLQQQDETPNNKNSNKDDENKTIDDRGSSSHQSDILIGLALNDDRALSSAIVMPPLSSFALANTTITTATNNSCCDDHDDESPAMMTNVNQNSIFTETSIVPVATSHHLHQPQQQNLLAIRNQLHQNQNTNNLNETVSMNNNNSNNNDTISSSPPLPLPPPIADSNSNTIITEDIPLPPPPPPTFSCVVIDAFPVAEDDFNDDPLHQSLVELNTSLGLLFQDNKIDMNNNTSYKQ